MNLDDQPLDGPSGTDQQRRLEAQATRWGGWLANMMWLPDEAKYELILKEPWYNHVLVPLEEATDIAVIYGLAYVTEPDRDKVNHWSWRLASPLLTALNQATVDAPPGFGPDATPDHAFTSIRQWLRRLAQAGSVPAFQYLLDRLGVTLFQYTEDPTCPMVLEAAFKFNHLELVQWYMANHTQMHPVCVPVCVYVALQKGHQEATLWGWEWIRKHIPGYSTDVMASRSTAESGASVYRRGTLLQWLQLTIETATIGNHVWYLERLHVDEPATLYDMWMRLNTRKAAMYFVPPERLPMIRLLCQVLHPLSDQNRWNLFSAAVQQNVPVAHLATLRQLLELQLDMTGISISVLEYQSPNIPLFAPTDEVLDYLVSCCDLDTRQTAIQELFEHAVAKGDTVTARWSLPRLVHRPNWTNLDRLPIYINAAIQNATRRDRTEPTHLKWLVEELGVPLALCTSLNLNVDDVAVPVLEYLSRYLPILPQESKESNREHFIHSIMRRGFTQDGQSPLGDLLVRNGVQIPKDISPYRGTGHITQFSLSIKWLVRNGGDPRSLRGKLQACVENGSLETAEQLLEGGVPYHPQELAQWIQRYLDRPPVFQLSFAQGPIVPRYNREPAIGQQLEAFQAKWVNNPR